MVKYETSSILFCGWIVFCCRGGARDSERSTDSCLSRAVSVPVRRRGNAPAHDGHNNGEPIFGTIFSRASVHGFSPGRPQLVLHGWWADGLLVRAGARAWPRHDGDTCAFNILLPAVFGTDIGVRLSGIDAPEIAGKCAKEKALALVARDFLRGQLAGASVQQQVFRDKFFRIEATVIANGVNINQLMVKKGFGALYTGTGPRHDWCKP